MAMASGPETRMMPRAPPGAVAQAQMVDVGCMRWGREEIGKTVKVMPLCFTGRARNGARSVGVNMGEGGAVGADQDDCGANTCCA